MGFVLQVVAWLVWAGFTAAVIMVDAKLRRDRLAARGEVDFTDTNPVPYLLVGILCSAASLPLYFYASRREPVAVLIGFALTGVTLVATVLVMVIVGLVMRLVAGA